MPGNSAHEYEVREAISDVVDAGRKFLDTDERPVRRDQHPKQNGCVRARFIVAKNLGELYRQGLFQEEKVYEAWIRLSNGRAVGRSQARRSRNGCQAHGCRRTEGSRQRA